MRWIMRVEFLEAFEKANVILKRLGYDYNTNQCVIKTADIISAVEEELNIDVKFAEYDFARFACQNPSVAKNISRLGAAMSVSTNENGKIATILLNEKETPEMQRFSLVHELGHLMLQNDETNGYKISTHIDMNITSISNALLDDPKFDFLVEEQKANIFALLVLIPEELLERTLYERDSITDVANFFGVEREAIRSRMRLSKELKGEGNDSK